MKKTLNQQINLAKRITRRYGKDLSVEGNLIPLFFDQNLVELCNEAFDIFDQRKLHWTYEWNAILDIRLLTASQPYLILVNDAWLRSKLKKPHTPLIVSYKGYHFIQDGHHSIGVHWLNRNWFVEVEQYDMN